VFFADDGVEGRLKQPVPPGLPADNRRKMRNRSCRVPQRCASRATETPFNILMKLGSKWQFARFDDYSWRTTLRSELLMWSPPFV